MVMRHMTEAPAPPSERVDRPIPRALDELVLRCLEKEPARRPKSARELSDRLNALGLEEAWTERRAAEWWEETEEARRAMAKD
jgi:serine/threonine-protein kinase